MKPFITFFSTILTLIVANTTGNAQSNNRQFADTVKATTFKVKGITCANDVKTIASNIEKLSGVINCKADKPGATTSFELMFNPARVTEKEIVAAIENTGGCENPNDRPYKVKQ
jgi:copper chaperone CopZ